MQEGENIFFKKCLSLNKKNKNKKKKGGYEHIPDLKRLKTHDKYTT